MKPKRTIEKRYLKITSAATANLSDALFPRYIRYISGIAQCTLLLSDSDYPLFSEPAAYLFIVLSITFKVRILTAKTQLLSN